MDDFPSNSQNRKVENSRGEERQKLDSVTSGKRLKKTPMQKFSSFIFGEDTKNVASYLFNEVFIPAAKNLLFDMIVGGSEMRIFGEVSRGRRYGDRRNSTFVSYDQVGRDRDRDRDRRVQRSFERRVGKPDEILIPTREEAKEVISRMYDIFDTYNIVSLADYYDLVGVESDWTDNKWGWDTLEGTKALRVNGGWIIDLPRMISLK